MNFKELLFFSLSLVFILSGCSSDEGVEEDGMLSPDGDSVFTARVNSMDFEAASDLINASIQVESGFYIISIAAGDPIDNSNAQAIALGMFGLDFDAVNAGTEWNTVVTDENLGLNGAVGGYAFGNATDVILDVGTDSVSEIFVRLTAINKNERLISGEFSFVSFDEDTNTTYTVTNGTFTNIEYELN